MHELEQTIVAPATGTQSTAIGVIRISGPQSFEILGKHFSLSSPPERGIRYGNFVDGEKIIDEVVVTFFPGPHSYTKQDTAEISCHGSPFIIEAIVSLLVDSGAYLAQPGEFTYRAYINGRMDLSQAEAVTDLIYSSTSAQHQIALNQLKGNVSDDIAILRQQLIDFASLIELELDFGEEDVEFADRDALLILVDEAISHINGLLESFALGNAIKKGVPVAIVGAPNAGKSTLLNALLQEDRAIVSDIPGTTRDAIEDVINIKGILFRLTDTAGIRDTGDRIEAEGVERALKAMSGARITLYLVDVTDTTPEQVTENAAKFSLGDKTSILLLNKMDLDPYTKPENYDFPGEVLPISASNSMNIPALKDLLYQTIVQEGLDENATILSNVRHRDAFQKAKDDLVRVKQGLENGIPPDLVAMDIRQGLYHIGTITGEISADDLLGNIFSRFCIGK